MFGPLYEGRDAEDKIHAYATKKEVCKMNVADHSLKILTIT